MKKLIIGAFAAAMLAAPALPAAAQSAHGIAAVVNDEAITTRDVQQRVLFMLVASQVEPTEENLARLQQQAIRALIDERLQIQEAKNWDVSISEDEVNRALGRLLEGNGMSVEQIQRDLSQVGVGLGTLRDQIRAELAWQTIVNGRYGSRVRISESQIDDTLSRLQANSDKPSYQVSEIFIEIGPDLTMDQAMDAAGAIIGQMREGAAFPVMAQQYSSAPSASRGGDVGWVLEGELRSEINDVITDMEVGTVSAPIQVPGGVYIVALRDRRQSESQVQVTLKQMAVMKSSVEDVIAAEALLSEATAGVTSCDAVEDAAAGYENVIAADLGTLNVTDLNPATASLIESLQEGQPSAPQETGSSVMSLVLCDRAVSGANLPSRNQIEDRLIDQQLSMLSKRYLRDIRRQATIESR